jgi:hypothetical protein
VAAHLIPIRLAEPGIPGSGNRHTHSATDTLSLFT